MEKIRSHKDLRVYQLAFEAALEIHNTSKSFPSEEKYSLTDQVRRSSRSVCANLVEAFRKRRYPKNFVLKLSIQKLKPGKRKYGLIFQSPSLI